MTRSLTEDNRQEVRGLLEKSPQCLQVRNQLLCLRGLGEWRIRIRPATKGILEHPVSVPYQLVPNRLQLVSDDHIK